MTPQQEALNGQVCELDVIKELQDKDQEIIEDLEGLKKGQSSIEKRLDKGAERMDGIEGEVKQVKDEIKSLKDMLVAFVQQSHNNHLELKSDIKDEKYQELRNDMRDRKLNGSTLKTGLILLVAGAVLSVLGYLIIHFVGKVG